MLRAKQRSSACHMLVSKLEHASACYGIDVALHRVETFLSDDASKQEWLCQCFVILCAYGINNICIGCIYADFWSLATLGIANRYSSTAG